VVATSNANCSAALTGATTCGDITAFQVDATTGRLTLVVNTQVTVANCGTTSTSCPLTYFPVPVDPIDFVLSSQTFLTLSGTPATGDSVFPYSYSQTSGQLTVNQNNSQPLNIHQATAINTAAGYIWVLDNEPITYTPTDSTTAVTAYSQILQFSVGTNGALQAQTGGAVPDDFSNTLANPIALMAETPKGSWVYVANVGNNTTSTGLTTTGIAGYILDSSSHQLTAMPGQPFGVGSGPQCIVEDPSNQFIYEGNFNDSTVTGQSIEQNTGILVPLSQSTRAPSKYELTGPATWCLVDARTS
jgi:hypothetical protein